ncbi:hypothetical protein HYPBUDRAFT_115572 [Hyphopichia burtonii NRRL Y-1933]|uniref:Protein CMS1 n=1 Tax=Hyphopichia burtonii NRRL Y-1933 TaxID=984485 RepID=A0A1E4RBL7_9ASCO|nr:hypothetical protein HYPBUDRAFT_115572 [Hyphopichia burtonii NRRL Y-1933]ODV64626.1 hypothetical protein HYPBUDRAFT_115572 [Hyphopichia burtonii NRRL Y-1933]
MSKTDAKPVSAGADDLDDGLDYEVDLSASDSEDVHLIQDEEETKSKDEPKHQTENNEGGKKRKAKSSKLQEKKRIKMEIDMSQKKNLSTETAPEVIADYINNKIRQKNSELSALELSELYLNKSDFRSTSEINDKPRNLDNLSAFIDSKFKNMLPNTSKKNKKASKNKKQKDDESESKDERKFISILSMSAIRACDIHRALRDIPGASLKLINKNKLHVDLNLVKSTRSRVLCCTPGRLLKVLDSEELQLKGEEIKIVILDNSYLDQKQQNVMDIKETFECLKALADKGSKIYLY